MNEDTRFSRRDSLLAAGGLIAAALIPEAASAAGSGSGPAAVASGAISCVLTPELTEGPYFVPGEKVRRNITEGKPGTPLDLRLTVVDASTCKPIKSAVVDIWHADALGVYSGAVANNPGTNFMRGVQKTDSAGLARFQSVYPGWYQGRAVHIHVKVHLGGNVVHTGQFFFNDTLTDAVYKKAPYSARGSRDTRNAADSIYRNGGSRSMLKVTKTASGYRGRRSRWASTAADPTGGLTPQSPDRKGGNAGTAVASSLRLHCRGCPRARVGSRCRSAADPYAALLAPAGTCGPAADQLGLDVATAQAGHAVPHERRARAAGTLAVAAQRDSERGRAGEAQEQHQLRRIQPYALRTAVRHGVLELRPGRDELPDR